MPSACISAENTIEGVFRYPLRTRRIRFSMLFNGTEFILRKLAVQPAILFTYVVSAELFVGDTV